MQTGKTTSILPTCSCPDMVIKLLPHFGNKETSSLLASFLMKKR